MMFSWFKKSPRKESLVDRTLQTKTIEGLKDKSARVEREYLSYLDELKQTSLEGDYLLPYKVVKKFNPEIKDTTYWLYEYKEGKVPVKLGYIPKGPDFTVELSVSVRAPKIHKTIYFVDIDGSTREYGNGQCWVKDTEIRFVGPSTFSKGWAAVNFPNFYVEIPYQLRELALDQLITQLHNQGFIVKKEEKKNNA